MQDRNFRIFRGHLTARTTAVSQLRIGRGLAHAKSRSREVAKGTAKCCARAQAGDTAAEPPFREGEAPAEPHGCPTHQPQVAGIFLRLTLRDMTFARRSGSSGAKFDPTGELPSKRICRNSLPMPFPVPSAPQIFAAAEPFQGCRPRSVLIRQDH